MRLFRHIYNIFVLAYLDNIVIFSKHKKVQKFEDLIFRVYYKI